MPAPSSTATALQLIRDTFRQARASGIEAIMIALTATCTLFCLSVNISGDASLYSPDEPALFLPAPLPPGAPQPPSPPGREPKKYETDPELARHDGIETISGQMTLAFGAVSIPLSRDRREAVQFLELLLAAGAAGVLGLLLTLVWTAGFLPSFLEPAAASVLFTKPVGRGKLLVGKYTGVLSFVTVQVLLFVLCTWLALAVKTHVWALHYWICVPLLLLQFAVFYSFSVVAAVLTRSTAACLFGSVLIWLLAWAINYGRLSVRALADPQFLNGAGRALTEFAYWIMPKPIDLGLIVFNLLDARSHFAKPAVFTQLETTQSFNLTASCLSNLVIAAALLALSVRELNKTDY